MIEVGDDRLIRTYVHVPCACIEVLPYFAEVHVIIFAEVHVTVFAEGM